MHEEILACPVCGMGLALSEQSLKCVNGHTFDVSAKGYANLLMSNDKHSKEPGDNKEMVAARRRFLEKGYYEPLAAGLSEVVASLAAEKRLPSPVILDAGCGEGYYTRYLGSALSNHGINAVITGVDISKDAIKSAVKKHGPQFYVASLFKLPIKNKSADVVVNAFAPACDSEFFRVLKNNGRLVAVIPGKKHLFTLKSIMYDSPYENDEKEPDLPSFKLLEKRRISGEITVLGNDSVFDLLSMTPYYWRTPENGVNRLKTIDSLKTAIEFIILSYATTGDATIGDGS